MTEPNQNAASTADREIVNTRIIDAPRELVWRAFSEPEHLAQWWGPKGFRNTFHEFDLRPGGHWRFIMHGPDGTDYKNESVFVEVVQPGQIVFDHVSAPLFRMTITLDDRAGKTAITWRMLFESPGVCDALKPICVPANEQNFDRLDAELAAMRK
jgi:uncharacterized protein YndB with AHSA1/START domain